MKKVTFHKIANSIDEIAFGVNHLAQIDVAGKSLCVARVDDKIFACVAKCPHASGKLSDGFLDPAGNIVCPLHGYRYDLHNGRNVTGEGYYLKTYPVEIRDDGVFIGVESGSFFH